MTRHVLPILGAPVGLTALSARIAARSPSPSALSPDPVFWSAVRAAAKPALMVGTVMERSHTPLSVWFWAAYLVASQTPGMSAAQFQRQLGLTRYETAFGILHKPRAGMVRPDQNRIGGRPKERVEVDETWVGGRTRGEGQGIHHKTLVAAAVEVRHRKPGTAQDKRKEAAMPVECDWPSPLTAAPIRCVALSRMPSCQAR
jgi:hypothetical protein